MPELPEVETIVRGLNRKIRNKTIKSVKVKVPKLIKSLNTKFVQALRGQKIVRVSRRAKLIKVELSNKKFLLVHLKMTGQLIFQGESGELTPGGHSTPKGLENLPNKFTHIIFTFTDSSQLFYNDLRKFGWMNILSPSAVKNLFKQEYGIEPLKRGFTFNKFKEILKNKSASLIKKVLMDQKSIAGIGNIYADESCFYAGIKPNRKIKTLTQKEIKKLWQGIKSILKSAIKLRGTSVSAYLDTDAKPGGYAFFLKVYSRAGKKCKRRNCNGVIKKIKLAGRGTHYCSKCQK